MIWSRRVLRAIEASIYQPEIRPLEKCLTCETDCPAHALDANLWCSWWQMKTPEIQEDYVRDEVVA